MLTVNLYGGPGAGKSTLAAEIFAMLKQRGVSAELVTEFAKDCAWEGRTGPLRCQPYMFGQQLWRMERLRDRGVDVAITDSPILMGNAYASDDTPLSFLRAVAAYAERERAVNVLVERGDRPYQPAGRFETEEEAGHRDRHILNVLRANGTHIHRKGIVGTRLASVVVDLVGEFLAGRC